METSEKALEALLNRKLALYQELADVVKEEKKSLSTTDVDALWKFSSQKQTIASKIEDLRKQILNIIKQYQPNHGITVESFHHNRALAFTPFKNDSKFKQICMKLSLLKEEVNGLVKGNKAFVEAYLSMMDEMINIILNADKKDASYKNPRFIRERKSANLLLHKEV